MMTTTYSLSLPTRFVRDQSLEDKNYELEAQIRSGYYFVTLATELELLAEERVFHHLRPSPKLEKIINDLNYLQEHYKITKKSK